MKKTLSLILVVLMVSAVSILAFAEEPQSQKSGEVLTASTPENILELATLPFSSSAIALAENKESWHDNTLYIASDDALETIMRQRKWDTITPSELHHSDISKYNSIVIAYDDLTTALKSNVVSRFETNARIIVLGDITVQTVRKYFGVESVEDSVSAELSEKRREADLAINNRGESAVDVSSFDPLGVLIYKTVQGVNATEIKIEDAANKVKVADGLEYCLSYDYIDLAISNTDKNRSGGYTNTWINVDVNTATYLTTRCAINTSIKLDKNSGNPNSDNEYLQYTPYVVDVDVVKSSSDTYSIRKVDVKVKGSSSSLIYDYGPLNQSCGASASVSFGLPYSVSVSFSPGSKVGITRLNGGINSNTVTIQYQIKTPIGLNGYEYDGVRCEGHIESYQRNTSYLYGYGQFNVYTYIHDFYSGEPSNLITYYNSTWDTASGS